MNLQSFSFCPAKVALTDQITKQENKLQLSHFLNSSFANKTLPSHIILFFSAKIFIQSIMAHTLYIGCLLGLILLACAQPTTVSYITEVEKDERQDFLELTIVTGGQSTSLNTAISEARAKARELVKRTEQACKRLVKDKSTCKQVAEIGKVDIKPVYKEQKKDTIFQKIVATESVTIKFSNVDKFGDLVDQLLRMEGIVVDKIEWKADQSLEESNFLKQSLEKNEQLCAQLGKNFIKVASVEQIRQEPEQPEEEEPKEEGDEQEEQQEQPQEEEPQQEEQEKTVYKITIICDGKKVKSSKSKAKK